MWLRHLYAPLLVGTLAAAGCASPIAIDVDYDRSVDVAAWSTWAWAPSPTPGTGAESPELSHRRIVRAVEQVLGERNWTKASRDTAECLVAFHCDVREEIDVVPRLDPWWNRGWSWPGSAWTSSSVDVWRYDVGTLILNLIDRRTGLVAWSGRASGTVESELDPAEREARIDAAVRKLLDRFPPAQ